MTMRPVAPLAWFRLLGRFDLRIDGVELPPMGSGRVEAVLAHLLLHREAPQPRQRVAARLWPNSPEAQARTNLRHVLHTIRNRLPNAERYLEITSRTVRWRPDAPYRLDVAEFERLLDHDDSAGGPERRQAVGAAVATYTGDLMEDCPDDWLLAERERLRRRYLDALAEAAGLYEASGELAEAISYAERLLRVDPLREQAYRQLMRLHDARGDRAQALRTYHVCCSVLERELGVEPSTESRATYRTMLPDEPDTRPGALTGVAGPFIGRVPAQAQLASLWRATTAGRAQFVLVTGEPGVGKTRLVDEFHTWCARHGAVTAEARCYAAEGEVAYGPVVSWLRSDALRSRLVQLNGARLSELARLLPELMVELPDLGRPAALPESEQRRRLFDAVSATVLAATGPVLLVLDDLQHADRETCQFVHYLLRARPQARLLVVATARREDIDVDHAAHELLAGLQTTDRLSELEVDRLGPAETAQLAAGLTGAPLGEPDRTLLYTETEGNPLFVVEAVYAGWAMGHRLSPRVQSVIERRLDQLSEPARDLVAVAAAIGRAFGVDVLAAAGDVDEPTLVRCLDELWRRRIVRERGGDVRGGAYDFSHDKIREVAYRRVSPARRRQLHLRIAGALQADATAASVTAQIAAHYDRAGAGEQAVAWYSRAAGEAQQLHANGTAVRHLDRALALLRSMPSSTHRDGLELGVQTSRLAPLTALAGYVSPAISAAQQRALDLLATLGVAPAPPLLRSLAMSSLTREDFSETSRFGRLLHGAGDCAGDNVLLVEAAYVHGIASFWQADFEAACRQFELAVARYRPEDRWAHLIHYAQDPRVICTSRLANTLWFLGRPGDAVQARSAALDWAEEIDHPLSRAAALTFATLLALDMGDEHGVRRYAAEYLTSARGPLLETVATAFRGYIRVLDGDTGGGIAEIRGAVRSSRQGGAAPGQPALIARTLLQACIAAADVPAALAAAHQLLDMGGSARVWAPEARRVLAAYS